MFLRRANEQPRKRLATVTTILVVMRAHVEAVDRKLLRKAFVNGINVMARARPPSDIGLIGDDEQGEACSAQVDERISDARDDAQFIGFGGKGFVITTDRLVDDAVSVEKNGAR